jgi:foldase protein PrsA
MTRTLTVAIIVFVAALGTALIYALMVPASGFHDSTPVAEVNGVTITRGEVQTALWRRHGASGLKTLADRAIIEQLARVKGLKPDPSRIDLLMTQEEMRAGGPQQLDERLAREGRTREQLRNDLASQALTGQVLAAQVQVSEDDIKAYYAAHRAQFARGEMIKGRLMVFSTRENAKAILEVLDEPGADFAGLARELSEDPGTKADGGDMGWIERKSYAKELTDAAFKLQPGRHTGIIPYPDGYAIILVEARKPAGQQSLEDVHDTIDSLLRNEKQTDLSSTWLAEERKKAQISIRDEALRKAFEAIRGS